ncbi:hypothetical protein HYDPIDRAFT_78708 [Hydnomerulius pinastri MD-312]|nr:hypothetical protein HYDPIDRAFT_78708 [Hydnomerulius pinastri MD-312]
MSGREKWAFSLDHSFHTSPFQVLVDSIWVEWMVFEAEFRDCRDTKTSSKGNRIH